VNRFGEQKTPQAFLWGNFYVQRSESAEVFQFFSAQAGQIADYKVVKLSQKLVHCLSFAVVA
jgi:hypothetical protein